MRPPPIPPPGRLVWVGGHRLHLHCAGARMPAVVFDAAIGGSSLSWTLVQPAVAEFATACTYDRGGFGWSEAGPMPRTADRLADELYDLLCQSGRAGPFVLVGHSFGGLTIRIFAARHPDCVAGLVFVDPAHPEDWVSPPPAERERIARGVRLCRHGALAARLGVASAVALLASTGAVDLARGIAAAASRRTLRREDEQLLAPVTKLPMRVRPMLRWMWTQPRFFEALGSQIEEICRSASQVDMAPDYGDLPLVTISASGVSPRRRELQERLARRSSHGRHVVAANSGHWIPLDEPQTVIAAVREVAGGVTRQPGRGSTPERLH